MRIETHLTSVFIHFKKKRIIKKKLTLTIDQSIIENAKKYAYKRDKSLSYLIENYLKALTKGEAIKKEELTPIVKSLIGSFKLLPSFDYKKKLTIQLSEKYLK